MNAREQSKVDVDDVALGSAFVVNPHGYAVDDFTRVPTRGICSRRFLGLLASRAGTVGLDHYVKRLEGGDSKELILD